MGGTEVNSMVSSTSVIGSALTDTSGTSGSRVDGNDLSRYRSESVRIRDWICAFHELFLLIESQRSCETWFTGLHAVEARRIRGVGNVNGVGIHYLRQLVEAVWRCDGYAIWQ